MLVGREGQELLSEPTFSRDLVRANLQALKLVGVDAIIVVSKLIKGEFRRVR